MAKVLVAGATGYLGRHVVRALHGAGHVVRALARDPERLGDVRSLVSEVAVAEATKPETVTDVVGDATVLVSSLGKHDFKRKPSAWEVDFAANRNLLERAQAGGVRRVVFVSVFRGPELRKAGISSAEARESVVDLIRDSGLEYVIVRPNGFFNDMEDFFKMAKSGTSWVIGDGTKRMNPIHGADLADVVARSVVEPAGGGVELDVGGPDSLTQLEIATLAFAALGTKPKIRRLPAWVLRGMAPPLSLWNPFVADLLRAVAIMSSEGAEAPRHGSHHLADFYRELAAGPASPAHPTS
ncbi:MAG: NAD(P)H-binding protein [Myxococcales bacterium]|nr:NAD(P)H-binding protein [Myxococcales bacterium]